MRLLKNTAGIDRSQCAITAIVRVERSIFESVTATLVFQVKSDLPRRSVSTWRAESALEKVQCRLWAATGRGVLCWWGQGLGAVSDNPLNLLQLKEAVSVLSWIDKRRQKTTGTGTGTVVGDLDELVQVLLVMQPDRAIFIHDPAESVFMDVSGSRTTVCNAAASRFPDFVALVEAEAAKGATNENDSSAS